MQLCADVNDLVESEQLLLGINTKSKPEWARDTEHSGIASLNKQLIPYNSGKSNTRTLYLLPTLITPQARKKTDTQQHNSKK